MLRYWTPLCVAAAMLVAVQATAAETPKPTMDLEILSNGKVLLRGELIDGIDELEAKLRVMRENEPPFELSLKLPKTIDLDAFTPFFKMLDDFRARFGFTGNNTPRRSAPIEPDSSTI